MNIIMNEISQHEQEFCIRVDIIENMNDGVEVELGNPYSSIDVIL